MKLFLTEQNKKQDLLEQYEDADAETVYLIERELGVMIDYDYPLMKYFSTRDQMIKYKERLPRKDIMPVMVVN